ncbi:hypothetical protein DL96DRAFT_1592791 [Flagelloscypha sp. PMI_526]|nr:hypothetical protein DL96DRAFT_1592791 [Flagelloscypha sp. PMI_526]
MSEDSSNAPSSAQQPNETPSSPSLLDRAKAFLQTPVVQEQDVTAKRDFLADKGLSEPEISSILSPHPPQLYIPPRTYPQPVPSNLLGLLIGILRIFSWLVGGSAFVLFIYQRVFLPRISRTSSARKSIRSHQVALLTRLNESLRGFKDVHTQNLEALPRSSRWAEADDVAQCLSIQDALKHIEANSVSVHEFPPLSLLRCAFSDYVRAHEDKTPSTQELFQIMEEQIPWLLSEDGLEYERQIWETLQACPLFVASNENTDEAGLQQWTYTGPELTPTPEVVSSLKSLVGSIPRPVRESNPHQHTLKSMTDLTGYISGQVYAPYSSRSFAGSFSGSLSPQQEELRREIRALKGLVLNRKTFMSSIGRSHSVSPTPEP